MTLPSPEERADLVRRLRRFGDDRTLNDPERTLCWDAADLIDALDAALTDQTERVAELNVQWAAALDQRDAADAALSAANQDAALGWEWAEQFVDPGLVTVEGWNEWLEDLAAHRARLSDGADDE